MLTCEGRVVAQRGDGIPGQDPVRGIYRTRADLRPPRWKHRRGDSNAGKDSDTALTPTGLRGVAAARCTALAERHRRRGKRGVVAIPAHALRPVGDSSIGVIVSSTVLNTVGGGVEVQAPVDTNGRSGVEQDARALNAPSRRQRRNHESRASQGKSDKRKRADTDDGQHGKELGMHLQPADAILLYLHKRQFTS